METAEDDVGEDEAEASEDCSCVGTGELSVNTEFAEIAGVVGDEREAGVDEVAEDAFDENTFGEVASVDEPWGISAWDGISCAGELAEGFTE